MEPISSTQVNNTQTGIIEPEKSTGQASGKTIHPVDPKPTIPKATEPAISSQTTGSGKIATALQPTPVEQAISDLKRLHTQFLEEKDTKNQKETIKEFYQVVNNLDPKWPEWKKYLCKRKYHVDGISYPKFTPEGTLKCLRLGFPEAVASNRLQYWHLEPHSGKISRFLLKQLLKNDYHLNVLDSSSFEEDLKLIKPFLRGGSENVKYLLAYPRALIMLMVGLSDLISNLEDGESQLLVLDLGDHKNTVYLRKKSRAEYRCLILDSLQAFDTSSDSQIKYSPLAHVFAMALQAALRNHSTMGNVYFLPGSRQNSLVHCSEFAMHDVEVLLNKPMVATGGYAAQPVFSAPAMIYSSVIDSVMDEYEGCGLTINGQLFSDKLSPFSLQIAKELLKDTIAAHIDSSSKPARFKDNTSCRLYKLVKYPPELLYLTQSKTVLQTLTAEMPDSKPGLEEKIASTSGLANTEKGEEKLLNLAAQERAMKTMIDFLGSMEQSLGGTDNHR